MARQRNLRNPPIVEAVVDIVTRYAEPGNPERFGTLQSDIETTYPTREVRQGFKFTIAADQGRPVTSGAPLPGGYVFRNTDNTWVVQSKIGGFSFSQLAPYRDWDTAVAEAMRVWETYRARFKPDRVLRLSVRFINRLKFPGPSLDFDNYIVRTPTIPPDLPQAFSGFSVAYVINEVAPHTVARVQMGFSATECTPTEVPVLLDIDILRECDIDPANLASIMGSLAELRVLKNNVFFGTLTEQAVKVFE